MTRLNATTSGSSPSSVYVCEKTSSIGYTRTMKVVSFFVFSFSLSIAREKDKRAKCEQSSVSALVTCHEIDTIVAAPLH